MNNPNYKALDMPEIAMGVLSKHFLMLVNQRNKLLNFQFDFSIFFIEK